MIYETSPNICKLYVISKNFFAMSKNMGLLLLKSSLIGLNQALKLQIEPKTRTFSAIFNSLPRYMVKAELTSNQLDVES